MAIFLDLVQKILPLYLMTGAGYLAGKYARVDRESLANLLLFILLPGVIFLGTYRADLNASFIIVPVLFFAVAAILCIVATKLAKSVWHDGTERLLGFSVGSSNTGYVGIPVAIALFGPAALPIAVLADFGLSFAVHSVGHYTIARTNLSVAEAFKRVLKFPTPYAFLLGLLCNIGHIEMPTVLTDTLELMKQGYSGLGMMIVGLGLATVQLHHVHLRFLSAAVLGKLFGWAAIVGGFLYVDAVTRHLLSPLARQVVLLLAFTPIAASTVAYSSRFHVHPEKAAIAVLVSTLLSLLMLPLVASML